MSVKSSKLLRILLVGLAEPSNVKASAAASWAIFGLNEEVNFIVKACVAASWAIFGLWAPLQVLLDHHYGFFVALCRLLKCSDASYY
jgi:hypothetical protein